MDYSLTTLFVVPVGNTLPSSGSTQDLTAGQVGFFRNDYTVATAGNVAAAPYFYVAQGRVNTLMQGSKRSDKIKGCPSGAGCKSNVIEWYKVVGCSTAANQITDITNIAVKCGQDVTLTLRAFSGYIDSVFFNGFTRSVTIKAPCCSCEENPCDTVSAETIIDLLLAKIAETVTPGLNPDNVNLETFFEFEKIGTDTLRIHGKALTVYGQPCDISAFPYEYDRMTFQTFLYTGAETTADFFVADACDSVATVEITQTSTYPKGQAAEIAQMEKNFHSYQTGIGKHLFTNPGYNITFESYVDPTKTYTTYYIKFADFDRISNNWGAYLGQDSTVVIAVESGSAAATALEEVLVAALGTVASPGGDCVTTTTTTTTSTTSTSTTTTEAP